jgi:uncharacterized surface protein with fasciclin (FAS1) repeats
MSDSDQDGMIPGVNEEEKMGVVVAFGTVIFFAIFFVILLRGCGVGDVSNFQVFEPTVGSEVVADTELDGGGEVDDSVAVLGLDEGEDVGVEDSGVVAVDDAGISSNTNDTTTTTDLDNENLEPAPTVAAVPATSAPFLDVGNSMGNATTGHIQLNGTADPGSNLFIDVNGEAIGSLIVPPNGTWNADLNLKPGDYVISARADDGQGGYLSSQGVTFTVTGSGEDASGNGLEAGENAGIETTTDDTTDTDSTTDDTASAESDGTDGSAPETAGGDEAETGAAPEKNLAEMIASNPNTTLINSAIQASGLAAALQGDGSFTVFLPSDEAIAKLPSEVLQALLANPEQLNQVIGNHVVNGSFAPSDLVNAGTLTTLNGAPLAVTVAGDQVGVGDGQLSDQGQPASNGYVYVIDKLLLPATVNNPPVIDDSGVPTFEGTVLTIVGVGEPNSRLLVSLNGVTFAETIVDENGRWLVSSDVVSGNYEIIAYTLDENTIPLGISKSVFLEVNN